MRSFLIIIGTLSALCSLSACLSEITLEAPDLEQTSIAIRGSLVATDTPYVLVKVTYVTDFRYGDIPQEVPGTSVSLMDEDGNQLEIPYRGNGAYFLDLSEDTGGLKALPGRSYRLRVQKASGEIYLSAWEPMHPVPAPTEVTQRSETRTTLNEIGNWVDQEFLRFYVTTPVVNTENGEGVFLKWSFSGTFQFTDRANLSRLCYISEYVNLENVVVFNGEGRRLDTLFNFFLLEEPYDYRFYEGYYLTIRQQSLSRNAYRYWAQLGELVNRSGGIFETPAGKIRGNFHNVADESEEVYGYFYATEESVVRYRVKPGEGPLQYLCIPAPDGSYQSYICLNCLAHPRSTTDRPPYWE